MTNPLGIQIGVPFDKLFVEPHVRLVSGACFGTVRIGRRSYCNDAILREGTVIGRYCSIARRVTIGAQRHPSQWLSSHPFQSEISPQKEKFAFTLLNTYIGNDVWIGENVVVCAGVHIGDGAIIGAGSVVTKDVAPYTIVGGTPARLIKKRFDDIMISRLLASKWWEINELFLKDLPFDDVGKCMDIIETTPNLDGLRSKEEFVFLDRSA
nr:CatB-related O-acetyltransferase [Acetobacter syzygii]